MMSEVRYGVGSMEVQVGNESVQFEDMVLRMCWVIQGDGSVILTKITL